MLYLYRSNAVFLQHFRRNCYGSHHLCCDQSCSRKSKRKEDEFIDDHPCCSVCRKIFLVIKIHDHSFGKKIERISGQEKENCSEIFYFFQKCKIAKKNVRENDGRENRIFCIMTL